ncbi:MAG: substrate-binding domain-containing protein, partial [Lachnospiraceae bacterium]|nr:substrate-binding domain-containing protein [Lachnospiraceae bacterium]
QCDGVIIAEVDFEDPAVIRLVNSEIPTVTLDYAFNNHTAIVSDNVSGVNEIVKFAYKRGHRKIAFIHGEMTAVTQIRLASFYRTCKELGIEVPEEYVIQATYHDPNASAQATKKILKLKDRPTCILYPDDFSFIGGMNVFEQEGLSIPDDISVAGYDGILMSQMLRPKLTTYQQDAIAIGKEASRRLVDIVENPKLAIAEVVQIPGKLLEGGTIKDLTKA